MEASSIPIAVKPANSPSAPVWMKRVPMITGVLAGLAGFLTVRSANMSNLANYNSTQAVLHQAKSSDAWNEYEAASLKRHINENALRTGTLDPAIREVLNQEIAKFNQIQADKKPEAESEATQRDAELFNGKQKLAIKDLLDYAGVAAQLGIALASIAALTRVRAAYFLGIIFGVVGISITVFALAGSFIGHLVWHR